MRKLVTIVFALILTIMGYGQVNGVHSKADPISFIDAHVGERVGTGMCRDLITIAFGYKTDNDFNKYFDANQNSEYMMKHQVGRHYIKSGDVVLFYKATYKDGFVIDAHVAVVYKVVNDSIIILAEQNVGRAGDAVIPNTPSIYRDSKVVLTEFNLFDFWGREYLDNHIAFYRF